jgi:antitoxin VapB
MALSIEDREADRLIRRFARLAGVSLADAVIIAMREAIERRTAESPLQAADRILARHGVVLTEAASRPLPRDVFDEMSGEH